MSNAPTRSGRGPVKLYRTPLSGHCHRVELMMAFLAVPMELIDLDMAHGAHKQPDYLAKNPLGQVPTIEDGGRVLPDSNAILTYLAEEYGDGPTWLGTTPFERGEVQRWLSIAAGELAAGPARARLVTLFGAPFDHEAAKTNAHALLRVIEQHLEARTFLVGERLTVADVSAYSYIAHAPEGGVALAPYPNLRAWLRRIEERPGFVAMAKSPSRI